MKAVIQRVKGASVSIDGEIVSEISAGLSILLGMAEGDTEEQVKKMAKKVADLRIMADGPSAGSGSPRAESRGEKGKMNLSVKDVNGEVLVVSQFTLLADTSRGNRPSFVGAAQPEEAKRLYELFVGELKSQGIPVKTGEFGAFMQVSLVNDGPVTMLLDSSQ